MFDRKGCGMQGSIAKVHTEKFGGRFLEGHAYYLHYLKITMARDTYCVIDHPSEAWLTRWIGITKITLSLRPCPAMPASCGRFRVLADVTILQEDNYYCVMEQ